VKGQFFCCSPPQKNPNSLSEIQNTGGYFYDNEKQARTYTAGGQTVEHNDRGRRIAAGLYRC
ncbi:MAG: hypothetical protein NC078_02615, partial [Ruminococcus sp.]|nr:hypothetical protein [Ruminococcus sp.]